VESDERRCFPISPDDDCRFALDIGDDHGVIVTAPGLACYVDRRRDVSQAAGARSTAPSARAAGNP
jgi:hypothetical protein